MINEWISVDDDLPQEDFEVIVCSDDDVYMSVFRAGYVQGDYYFDVEIEKNIVVTHWMPLPEPPK